MKKCRPEEFEAKMKEYYPDVPIMGFLESIDYLNEKDNNYFGWSIRYYGHGEHLTFWVGDGTFIDFGIDQDTKITWGILKKIIIESAMARKEFDNKAQW